MFKRVLVLGAAAVAVLAMGSSSASANWYHQGVSLASGQNPHISLTGTGSFASPNGGLHCPTTDWTLQLTGGTTTAHLVNLTTTNPSTCEVSGGLVFLTGGTTSLKSATLTPGATVHSNGSDATLAGVALHTEFNNGFKITLLSIAANPMTAQFDNKTKITKWTITGSLGSPLGNLSLSFQLHDHAATYGIAP